MKNYIITQDVGQIMRKWAKEMGFIIPKQKYFDLFFKELTNNLQNLFSKNKENIKVKPIFATELSVGIKELIKNETECPVISLDKVYSNSDYYLEINRVVCRRNMEWEDQGEFSRPGHIALEEQLNKISSLVKNSAVIIVDDGCWTGNSINKIINGLFSAGVKVKKVVVGVLIKGEHLRLDVPIEAVFNFSSITKSVSALKVFIS